MANPSTADATSELPPPCGERYTLEPESELRLEVPHGQSAILYLMDGSAEVFGAELARNRPYDLGFPGGCKVAIFTWHGCTLDVDGRGKALDIVYVSDETNANVSYVNTHAQLEAIRDEALTRLNADPDGDVDGPRVLLAGPADSGKSALARVLCAYAVKCGRTPLLADLDVALPMLSVPGTVGVSPVTPDAVSPEAHMSPDGGIPGGDGIAPLVLWYGSSEMKTNPQLYKAQLKKLGKDMDARLSGDADARASGVIINAGGWIDGKGYELLLHAADTLRANVILVMGHDRLYSMLTTHFRKRADSKAEKEVVVPATGSQGQDAATKSRKAQRQDFPKVIKLPRSGGVVSRDDGFRRACRNQSIRRYFHGEKIMKKENTSGSDSGIGGAGSTERCRYTPFLVELPFSALRMYRLSSVSLSAALLPVSAKQSTDPVQLTSAEMGPGFKHAIMAVCHPSELAPLS